MTSYTSTTAQGLIVRPPCEYVRTYYGVPAEPGRRVIIDGKPGIIAKDKGAYIGVLLDEDPPNRIRPYHPTWKVEYGGLGTVRKMTRSQQRYQEYLEIADCFESFGHWLRYKQLEASGCLGCFYLGTDCEAHTCPGRMAAEVG